MTKRILVDLDSTVVNMLEPLIATYNADFGDHLAIEDVKGWDLDKYAKHGHRIFDVMNKPSFFRDLKPLIGAIEAVKFLIDAGKDVYIVTAVDHTYSDACKSKAEWVKYFMPFIDKRHYITAGSKWLIDADAIVDDAPRNAIDYRREHPDAKVVGIEFPYNRDCAAFDFVAPSYLDTYRAWTWINEFLLTPDGECFAVPGGLCAGRGCAHNEAH